MLTINGDALHLKSQSTQREIIVDRRNSAHDLSFPMFSRADIILEDSLGERLLFSAELSNTERVERWWTWPSRQSASVTSQSIPDDQRPGPPVTVRSATSPRSKSKQGLAIASLVCGILGGWASTLSIPAVICGHMALNRIKTTPTVYGGKGMAIAGLVLGYVGLVLAIILGTMRGILRVQLHNMGY